MKRELDSDTDNFESLASDNTMTDVSSMDQYASCETLGTCFMCSDYSLMSSLDSIATMTDEKVSRPVSGVFKQTDKMMAETEDLIKNSYDAAYKALGATGEYILICIQN